MKNISRRDAFRVLAGGAVAMAGSATLAQEPAGHLQDPLTEAGDHGLSKPSNIGIIVTYGTGNVGTPEEVGDFLVSKLQERLDLRLQNDPSLTVRNIDAKYFVEIVDFEGIGVTYMMGGDSIGPIDVYDSFSDELLDKVIDKRENTARLLADATNTIDLARN